MNDVLRTIFDRSSYRGTYRDAPVPREDLRIIMEAGLAAPSGCNKQTTSLIAVDDPALVEKVKTLIDPPICETAPAFILVLTEPIIAYGNRTYCVQDYAAAIENMLLALRSLGYESCWYEGHITDADNIGRKIADCLGVPERLVPVCLLPVGIPKEAPKRVKKQPFETRAWFNGCGRT